LLVIPGTLALCAVLAGNAAMAAAAILAQTSGGGAADIAPWVSGAGSMTAVAGIVYIARLMATGQLVARDPAAENEALKDYLRRVLNVEEAGRDREVSYHNLLVDRYEAQTGRRIQRDEGGR
jgi:hypothetical protein